MSFLELVAAIILGDMVGMLLASGIKRGVKIIIQNYQEENLNNES